MTISLLVIMPAVVPIPTALATVRIRVDEANSTAYGTGLHHGRGFQFLFQLSGFDVEQALHVVQTKGLIGHW